MSTLNAVLVFVSISVITGDLASVGRTTLLTAFLTSSITSFTSALVFVVTTIFDIPSDEVEVILSTHLISFISLYILSVISLSISSGLVPIYTVLIEIIPSLIDGLDSFGIDKTDINHIIKIRRTMR